MSNHTKSSGSKAIVVLGSQWGDEGKGKIVDLLCQTADVVCRFQVANHYRKWYLYFRLTLQKYSSNRFAVKQVTFYSFNNI